MADKYFAIRGNDSLLVDAAEAEILSGGGWLIFPANASTRASIFVLFPHISLPEETVENDVALLYAHIDSDPFAVVWCTFNDGGYDRIVRAYACGQDPAGLYIVYIKEGGRLYVCGETGRLFAENDGITSVGEGFKIFDTMYCDTLKDVRKGLP